MTNDELLPYRNNNMRGGWIQWIDGPAEGT